MNTVSKWSARLLLLVSLVLSAGTAWASGQGAGCAAGKHHKSCSDPVPEPASLALLGVGVGAILYYRHRRGPKK